MMQQAFLMFAIQTICSPCSAALSGDAKDATMFPQRFPLKKIFIGGLVALSIHCLVSFTLPIFTDRLFINNALDYSTI